MKTELWQRVRDLFEAVAEMPPDERRTYLDLHCADDPALRAEVESLLRHDGEDEEIRDAVGEAAATIQTGPNEPGQTIGPYRLMRELGRGGMGVVWLAVRDDDEYRKEVAIKLLREAADPELRARFLAERQILATLDHPNIARLLHGGTTDDGVPYVVMEHVRGRPIDVYCARQQLSTEERLRLFCTVCTAVQYAHRNLVVHRDIKPTNLLVDAAGVPKLLDFGIAKLLDPSVLSMPVHETRTGSQLLTPQYASPEQIRGEPITTATDVYSLGVLLYELLTGRLPYRVTTSDPLELARAICEHEPTRPSAAVEALPDEEPIARDLPAARLRRQLTGDLDNVVLMALRKEPSRRYGSAEELADDLRRHLEKLPVRARPSTWRYRIGKFASRNRWGLLAASITALVMVAATIFSIAQMRVAVRARQVAEQERGVALIQAQRAILTAARARIDAQEPVAAHRLLGSVEEADRGWEWKHLQSELDRSIAVISAQDAVAAGLTMSGNEIITVSREGVVQWWDPIRSEVTATSRFETDGIRHAVFSLDGRRLAVVDGSAARHVALWELNGDDLPGPLFDESLDQSVIGVAISRSGSEVVVTTRDSARLWTSSTTEPLEWHHEAEPVAITMSENGQRVAIVTDESTGSYRLLDPRTPGRADTTIGRDIISLALSPDGTVAATGETDRVIRLRDAASARVLRRLDGHTSPPDVLAFSPDGRWLASAAAGEAVRWWDVASAEAVNVFLAPARVLELRFDLDGTRLLAFTDKGEARLWSAAMEPRPLQPHAIRGHQPLAVRGQEIAYWPDGSRAITGTSRGVLRMLDHASGELFDLVDGVDLDSPGVTSLAVSPDGLQIVTGHEGEAIVRDAATPARGTALDSGSSEVVAVSFSPSGERFVTLAAEGHAIVWDASTLAPVTRVSGPPSPGGGAAFSHDDSQLATTHEDGVRFWSPVTGDLLHAILIPGRGSNAVAYRPDGTQVATGWSDGSIRLANASTGQVRDVLAPHSTGVHAMVYSPDGVRLASGSRDGSIWLSDVETASPVLELRGHSSGIVSLEFSPDGSKLISGAEDSELRVWDTLPRRLRRRAAAGLHDQREQLRPLVSTLFEQTPDPTLVARALRSDPTLDDSERKAALQLTLDPPMPPSDVRRDPFDGYAYESEATESYVRIAPHESLRMTDAFTLEAWIQPRSVDGAPRRLGTVINKEGEYQIAIGADGGVIWIVAGPDGWEAFPWSRTRYRVPLDRWSHLALVRDGSTVRFYINGRHVHTRRVPEQIGDHDPGMNELRIGGRQHTSSSFRGRIDDVRIWGVARSSEQIRESMRRRLRGDEPGLLGAWQFDEGAGRVAHDLRGRHVGTLVGGVWSPTDSRQ